MKVTLYICYNHAIFILGIWSLRVGSTDYDDFIVLSFVGQTRYFTFNIQPITNMVWVRTRFVNYKKGYTRLAATSDKVYQLLAHGRRFSPGTRASSTGRHDIAGILLKVALNTKNQTKPFDIPSL